MRFAGCIRTHRYEEDTLPSLVTVPNRRSLASTLLRSYEDEFSPANGHRGRTHVDHLLHTETTDFTSQVVDPIYEKLIGECAVLLLMRPSLRSSYQMIATARGMWKRGRSNAASVDLFIS